jgi:hypothetical protein
VYSAVDRMAHDEKKLAREIVLQKSDDGCQDIEMTTKCFGLGGS